MITLTEQCNTDTQNIDLMSASDIAKAINKEDKKVAIAVEKEIVQIGKAIDLIANAFLNGGRLAYFGAGTSGRIGVLDASECVPTFSVEEGLVNAYIAGGNQALRHSVEYAEDDETLAQKDFNDFAPQKNDVVVGISASGNPKYLLTVLKNAQQKGVQTIGVSANPHAEMKKYCDIFICPVTGAEAITGSSRMKAGTAQKMVLNMLSTGAMIKIGKTYRNYMIDVKISNQKLYERGCRFVCEICNVSMQEAQVLLENAGGSVKTACVMAIKKCSRTAAEDMLLSVGGILRKIIG
jgi:N-acetylmuramic acid 6-phosphate etherase